MATSADRRPTAGTTDAHGEALGATGVHILRYGLVLLFLMWGGEMCRVDAEAVKPLIEHSLNDDGTPRQYMAIRGLITERKEAELALIVRGQYGLATGTFGKTFDARLEENREGLERKIQGVMDSTFQRIVN